MPVWLTGDGDAQEGHLDFTAPLSVGSSVPSVPTPKILDGAHSLNVESSQPKGIGLTIYDVSKCLRV